MDDDANFGKVQMDGSSLGKQRCADKERAFIADWVVETGEVAIALY